MESKTLITVSKVMCAMLGRDWRRHEPPRLIRIHRVGGRRRPSNPGLAVSGVMIIVGLKTAFVCSRGGANGAWIKEGEDFMGWKVVSINRVEQGFSRPVVR